ncbi:MAG: riboflavin synthase, partial [Puniceicoccaceae bacterium]
MFTGLIEETGTVTTFQEGPKSWRLTISADKVCQGLQPGDSIAVNGCCLTAVDFGADHISFDLLAETIRLTSFQTLRPGVPVNLERSLLPTTRMGGHFVSGHVDGLGTIRQIGSQGKDTILEIEPPADLLKYLAPKGCIAVDGISLTVAEVKATT